MGNQDKTPPAIEALICASMVYLLKLMNLALPGAELPLQGAKPDNMNLTTFEHWQRYHPNYGSFQTRLFEAYEAADDGNREKLEEAFPFWFTAAALLDEREVREGASF